MAVSPETLRLVRCSIVAQHLTAGSFDAFMGREIAEQGYDVDFASLPQPRSPAGPETVTSTGRRRRSALEVARAEGLRVVDARRHVVRLPPRYTFDSGGLGKGLAADLISREVMERGARACLVNLGGDVCVRGQPERGFWEIGIDDESGQRGQDLSVKLRSGGLCTSSLARRRWHHAGRDRHHLLNPRTGHPVAAELAAATAVAPQSWLAEAFSKMLILDSGPRASRRLSLSNAVGIVQSWSGDVRQLPAV